MDFHPEPVNGIGKWHIHAPTLSGWHYSLEQLDPADGFWKPLPDGQFYGNGQPLRYFVTDGPLPSSNTSMPSPPAPGPGRQLRHLNFTLQVRSGGTNSTFHLSRAPLLLPGQANPLPAWDSLLTDPLPSMPAGSRVLVFQSYDDPAANITWLAEFHVSITGSDPPPDSFPDTSEQAAELTVFQHLKPALLGSLTSPGTPGPPAAPGPKGLIRLRRSAISSQANGIPDWWYLANAINPFQNYYNANLDNDGDGLTNVQEFAAGTDPKSGDSDHDGAPDGYENSNGVDPLNPDAYPPILRWVTRWGTAHSSVPHPLSDGSTTFYDFQNVWLYGENVPADTQISWQGTPHYSTLGAAFISFPGLPDLPPPTAERSHEFPPYTNWAEVERWTDGSFGQASHSTYRLWLEQKPAPAEPVNRVFMHLVSTKMDISVNSVASTPVLRTTAVPITFVIQPAPNGTGPATSPHHDLSSDFEDMNPVTNAKHIQELNARLNLVEFNIFNGQNALQMVPENSEETVGAFTVANLNDTDGDGDPDGSGKMMAH